MEGEGGGGGDLDEIREPLYAAVGVGFDGEVGTDEWVCFGESDGVGIGR